MLHLGFRAHTRSAMAVNHLISRVGQDTLRGGRRDFAHPTEAPQRFQQYGNEPRVLLFYSPLARRWRAFSLFQRLLQDEKRDEPAIAAKPADAESTPRATPEVNDRRRRRPACAHARCRESKPSMRPEFSVSRSPVHPRRLLDDAPRELTRDPARNARSTCIAFKQSVARDMEVEIIPEGVDLDESIDHFPQARKSMIDYGITDPVEPESVRPGDRAYQRQDPHHRPAPPNHAQSRHVSLDAHPNGAHAAFRVDARLESCRPGCR